MVHSDADSTTTMNEHLDSSNIASIVAHEYNIQPVRLILHYNGNGTIYFKIYYNLYVRFVTLTESFLCIPFS